LRGVSNVIDYNNSGNTIFNLLSILEKFGLMVLGRYYQNERRTSSPPKPQQSFGLQAEIKLSEDEIPHAEVRLFLIFILILLSFSAIPKSTNDDELPIYEQRTFLKHKTPGSKRDKIAR
jgi:hypothetical protein